MFDIAATRLHAQRLAGVPFLSPVETVGRMGAVQAQDLAGAKWALGLRTPDVLESEVDRLFDEGAILRTHVMRPTWHFVLPKDIRWMLELTGARIRAGAAGRYRRLEIDDRLAARAEAVFEKALTGGRHLTRSELGDALGTAGITSDGQRLPHLLMAAELRGLLASGPRRGRQATWALLEERAAAATSRPREEAVADLVYRYFATRGPAQLQDFVWWSGLTMADARAGIAAAGDALAHHEVENRKYLVRCGWGAGRRYRGEGPPAAQFRRVHRGLPRPDGSRSSRQAAKYRAFRVRQHPCERFDGGGEGARLLAKNGCPRSGAG